jgi:hypothetical protein
MLAASADIASRPRTRDWTATADAARATMEQ